MVTGLFRMIRLVGRHRGRFAWFLFVSLVFGGLSSSYVVILRAVTGILVDQQAPGWLLRASTHLPASWQEMLGLTRIRHAFFLLLILTAFIALAKCGCQYLRRYLRAWLTRRVVMDAQSRLAEHLLSLDLEFFQKERAGELLSRLTNDLMFLGNSVKLACVLITNPITLLWFLIAVFYLSWQLALLGLIAAPVGGMLVTTLSRKMRKASRLAQERKASLTSAMVQFLTGMRIVKAFACEDFESREFHKENRKLFDVSMKRERARARVRPVVEFVSFFGTLLVLAVGGEWVFNGTLMPKDLIAFLGALGMMYAPAKEISRANSDLQTSLPGADRVFHLMDLKASVKQGGQVLEEFQKGVEFEGVSFHYTEETPVLRDVTFGIERGRCVALVGPSGSGKSTLTNLLLRFYDPTAGRITIDGQDIRSFTFDSVRDKMALVSQDPFLFNCSVAENIAYGRQDAKQEQIEAAARAANIHDEILGLPQGYQTVVGERGENLSGGQRQRVAIARALFKNAPILILDEATSSLDSEGERKVQEALDHLLEGRTTLVIAHRLSTVRHADQILVLEECGISAQGKHEELMLASPTYANLVRLQSSERKSAS